MVGTGVGFVAVLMIALAGCASSVSPMPSSASAPAITTQPAVQVVNAGQTATFSVVATGTAPLSYQWQKDVANISGATALSYTTPATAAADNGAAFRVVVSNSVGTATSNSATLTVNAAVAVGTDVTTYHNDAARTGQNLTETTLTTTNVNSQGFGLLRNLSVDGKVDAEPLYLSQLSIAGSAHNVVFVATEHDSVFAFDSDTGAQLWKASVLGSGETTSDDRGCGQVTPEIGITSTPVIDRTAGQRQMIYVVAMSKNGSAYFQRLHALDVTTGAEQLGGPVAIQATYPGTGAHSSAGQVVFDPKQYEERAGLLLLNGVVYTSWTSHCASNSSASPAHCWRRNSACCSTGARSAACNSSSIRFQRSAFIGISVTHLAVQPGPSGAPVACHCDRRHFEYLGRFFEIQSTEESQLHNLCLAGVDFSQGLQSIIQCHNIDIQTLARLQHPSVVQG